MIGSIAINKDIQGKSFGTKMITALVNHIVENSFSACLFITVDAYNKPEVINFYEKIGFVRFDIEEEDNRTVPMVLSLRK